MYRLGAILVGAGLVFALAGPAAATTNSCTVSSGPDDNSSTLAGSSSIAGCYIGTLGFAAGDIDEIGALPAYPNSNLEDFSTTTSYIEFLWGGGSFDMPVQVGNSEAGYYVNMGLYSNNGTNSSNATSATELESIGIAVSSGPTSGVIYDGANLAAGYYDIGYSLTGGPDPKLGLTLKAPEPVTISIFGAGLLGAAAMRRRKKVKQV